MGKSQQPSSSRSARSSSTNASSGRGEDDDYHSGSSGGAGRSNVADGKSTLLKLVVLLLLCLFIMAFAGSLSVTMFNKQIEMTKLKMLQETPDSPAEMGSFGNTDPNAAPIGVVDANPLLGDNTGDSTYASPSAATTQNVSYPSLKREGAIDIILKEKVWGTVKEIPLVDRYTNEKGVAVRIMKKLLGERIAAKAGIGRGQAPPPTQGTAPQQKPARRGFSAAAKQEGRVIQGHFEMNGGGGNGPADGARDAEDGENDGDVPIDIVGGDLKSGAQKGERAEEAAAEDAPGSSGIVASSTRSSNSRVLTFPDLPKGTTDHCALELLPTVVIPNASSRLCSGGVIGEIGAPVGSCRMDRPHRQGNLTLVDDLRQFAVFPAITDILPELEALSSFDLEQYWADYPTGLFPICGNWREYGSQLAFHSLYTLRRWFRVHKWLEGAGHAGRGDALIVNQHTLEFHDVNVNVFSNPPNPKALAIKTLRADSIFRIYIAPSARLPNALWFVNISFDATAVADFSVAPAADHDDASAAAYGHKKLTSIFLEAPTNCMRSLLRTLYALHRPLFGRVRGPMFEDSAFNFERGVPSSAYHHRHRGGPKGSRSASPAAAAAAVVSSSKYSRNTIDGLAMDLLYPDGAKENLLSALPTTASVMGTVVRAWAPLHQGSTLPAPWPYTPCHKFDQQQLQAEATEHNNIDSYKLFWPFKCDRLRETDRACGQEESIESRRQGLRKVPIQTAVVFAGFLRSFGVARFSLWDNIVKPLQATPFAATWNVLGRTKKTDAITRKMLVPVDRMLADVASLLMLAPHVNASEYVQVYNYFDYFWLMAETKKHGFAHAGLYFLMSKSIQLVTAHETKFEIIIRARFDVVALVPMRIVRVWREGRIPTVKAFKEKVKTAMETGVSLSSLISTDVEYVMDFGASCELQGLWWPQYVTIHDDKILKPPADTRYKFFGWQVCDWMEIGTYDTMAKLGNLMDWINDNYVFSAAQWVDHNYYISQGIAYLPTQMYLKILRKKGKYFG